MKITLHNYEAYLLDYFEGNLNEELIQELQAFALSHPELGISLEDADMPVLENEELSGGFGGDLLKFQTPDEEDICRYLEGLMFEEEKNDFEKRLISDKQLAQELAAFRKTLLPAETILFESREQLKRDEDPVLNNVAIACVEGLLSETEAALVSKDQELAKEIGLYRLTKLKPDTEVIFENKKSLKKSGRVIPLFSTRTIAAAAGLFLFTTVSVLYMIFSDKQPATIAVKISSPKQEPAAQGQPVVSNDPEKETGTGIPREKTIDHMETVRNEKTAVTVSAHVNQDIKDLPPEEVNAPEQSEPSIATNDKANKEEVQPQVAVVEKPDTTTVKRTIAFDELPLVEDDLAYSEEDDDSRPSLWQRVTRLAGQANRLGVKSVDGEVRKDEGFRLSIKSISVEKK